MKGDLKIYRNRVPVPSSVSAVYAEYYKYPANAAENQHSKY